MRKPVVWVAAALFVGWAAFLYITAPQTEDAAALAGIVPDLERGAHVFTAAGCASCHSAPDAEGEDRLVLSGGRRFPSPFGTFVAPNISAHPDRGIGRWSALELVNALRHGTGPDRQHYYPAFPYSSYVRMTTEDAVSLHAYLATLPLSDAQSQPHDVGFPFNIRRTLGGWKWLFVTDDFVLKDTPDPVVERGRYLVEALGHCGECHTPRNALGGLRLDQWLGGAPHPSGKGSFPNITPGGLDWSAGDIVEYLTSGFTPEFDTAGGEMTEVIENTAALPLEDRQAIAAYLKAVPPVTGN